ncbi:LLM class flavin-dependent oxidoreductase [Nocardioides marinquilinus]|uniref:LLM class flavin-dependent oxidoreductase n=1 Tax=Nocardioides marinquilinus TaxID=1210400 RepID=A0ABP9PRB2_9ACTN
MTSLGVVFRPQSPPEQLRAVVEAADAAAAAGAVDELWFWEDCFLEGGLTQAALALAWSSRLRVGIGLLPVPLRNPAVVAMEAATLARAFPGRLVLTLGHGVQDWMAQVGARPASPMALLREHTTAVRDLLAGERVDADGDHVRLDGVALDWPPAAPPTLLLGARGPRTLRLAGELADGVVLDAQACAEPDAVREARATVQAGRDDAGRPGATHVTCYVQVGAAEVSAERVGERVRTFADAGGDTVVLQSDGDAPDPRPLLDALTALAADGHDPRRSAVAGGADG